MATAQLEARIAIKEISCEEAGCSGCGLAHMQPASDPTYWRNGVQITKEEYNAEVAKHG